MAKQAAGLTGARILVVEDEALISMLIESMLEDWGCQVVGPVGSVAAALQLVNREGLDGALLDVNLGNEEIFPVAEALLEKRVPMLFLTGYDRTGLQARYPGTKVLAKPLDAIALAEALAGAVRDRVSGWRKST